MTLISAELPRGDTDSIKQAREIVKKYQVHKCVPNRCFMSHGKILKHCKYGFPAKLQPEDKLSSDGIRYLYKKTHNEDLSIVPYNLKLLMLWDAHVNVQYVTKRGIENYLVKYIAKIEPIFFAKMNEKANEVQKFLECRLVSSVEAATIVNGHHLVQCDIDVLFIDTSLPGILTHLYFYILKPYFLYVFYNSKGRVLGF